MVEEFRRDFRHDRTQAKTSAPKLFQLRVKAYPYPPNTLARLLKTTPEPRSLMVQEGMSGEDQQQNHIFSYLSPEARVRKDHPLRTIRAMVDQVLSQLSQR